MHVLLVLSRLGPDLRGCERGASVDPSVSGLLMLFKQHLEKRRTAPAEEPPVCLPSITRLDSCCQALRRFSYLSNNISPALKQKKTSNIGKSIAPPQPPPLLPPIINHRHSDSGSRFLPQDTFPEESELLLIKNMCISRRPCSLPAVRWGWGGQEEETRSDFGRGESRSGAAVPSKDTACANRPGAGTITAPSPSRAGLTNDRSTP